MAAATAANTRTLRLPVGGMTCAACVAHVEDALRHEPGVEHVSVNLMTRSAVVDTAGGSADDGVAERLVQRIKKAGYTAHVPATDDDVTREQERGDEALREEASGRLRRAIVALVSAAVAMVVSMPVMHGSRENDKLSHLLMGIVDPPLRRVMPWLYEIEASQLRFMVMLVFVPIVAAVSWPIATRAFAALRAKTTDMNTLVILGVSASVASSFLGDIAVDAALFIVGFVLLGQSIEARARGRTSAALSALASLRSEVAHLERADDSANGDSDGANKGEVVVTDVDPSDLRIGDVVVVFPGERVCGDGTVVSGAGSVDESHLTGESRPVDKIAGAKVLAGSINGSQPLRVRLEKLGKDSTLHQLLALLRDAQARRAPTQRLADRVASVFVPGMIALAAMTFVVWVVIGSVDDAVAFSIAVLVVACPCAMGLAVPTAVVAATGVAARAGVLIKGGDVLERLAHVQTVVFDKTGTLTTGAPKVVATVTADGHAPDDVIALAAGLEAASEHPIAKAIRAEAVRRGVKPKRVKHPRTVEGQGIVGVVGVAVSQSVGIGNITMVQAQGLTLPSALSDAADNSADAAGSHYVIESTDEGSVVVGVVVVADALRDDAGTAIAALHAAGVHTELLSGDRARAVLAVQKMLGIQKARAEVSPQDKLMHIEGLAGGSVTAFVGDGVNDAAALAAASVGIGIGGGGSDVAVAAADVAMMRPRLLLVPELLALAQKTRRVMLQNLSWAFGYNLVMLPLAAGLLSSWGLVLSPILASVAMSLSSVTVVMNSVRLTRARLSGEP